MQDADGWVYVVDDELSIREALTRLIRSAGWRVKSFESAGAFLEFSRPQSPGCLILDVNMPGLNGIELQHQLERAPDKIPIIFLTGNGDVPTAVRAMKAGAMEFLTKPFNDETLLTAIRQGLARWSLRRPAPDSTRSAAHDLAFDPFQLDVREQCLWRCGEGHRDRVLLSPKAFTVLRYLAERPGRLVTEDELLEAAWANVYVQPEAVKHRLYEIRKTLGDNPKSPRFIETLQRRGYRFIAAVRQAVTTDAPPLQQASVHHSLPGRGPALARLHERLQLALNGQRQVVFVQGDLGLGKTALVEEFQRLAALESPRLRVAHGHCIEDCAGRETYYPVLEALGSLCRQSTEIVDVLGSHAPTWLVQFPYVLTDEHRRKLQQEILGTTRERMLREIALALETCSTGQPLLMILEDLQWADGPTLNVVSELARRRSPAQLMLIATSRPVDVPLNTHPLHILTNDLLARGLCCLVDLEPLTERDIVAYLSAESPDDTAREPHAELLHRMSGGNPLFLRAALDHLGDLQLASRTSRGWEFKSPLPANDLPIPQAVQIVIESQLQRVGPQDKRALEAASLVGLLFTAAEAAGTLGDDIEELEAVFASLASRKRFVRRARQQPWECGRPCYEFSNPLYRDALSGQSARSHSSAAAPSVSARVIPAGASGSIGTRLFG